MDIYAIRFKIIFPVITTETELCSFELKSNRFIRRKRKHTLMEVHASWEEMRATFGEQEKAEHGVLK